MEDGDFFSKRLCAFFVCVARGFFAGRRARAPGDFARGTERFFVEILSPFGDSFSVFLVLSGVVDLIDTTISTASRRDDDLGWKGEEGGMALSTLPLDVGSGSKVMSLLLAGDFDLSMFGDRIPGDRALTL
jgi:hypothetical protein